MRLIFIFIAILGSCQSIPSVRHHQKINETELTDALGTIINDVLGGAEKAAKDLIASHLNIDPSVLNNKQRIGEVAEVALEKIVDNLNGFLSKIKPSKHDDNDSSAKDDDDDNHKSEMDYLRLTFGEKLGLLFQTIFNKTSHHMHMVNNMTSQLMNVTIIPTTTVTTTTQTTANTTQASMNFTIPTSAAPNPQQIQETIFLNLLKCLLQGIEEFFQKFEHRGCFELAAYRKKVYLIKCELNRLVERVHQLESEKTSENEEIVELKIEELKKCFVKLVRKLFQTVDAFFKKNSHIHDREFQYYKRNFYKLKSEIERVLKSLAYYQSESSSGSIGNGGNSLVDYQETGAEHESADSYDDEMENEHISGNRQLKKSIKCLIKSVDEKKSEIEKAIDNLKRLDKYLNKIKCELAALLKKVEKEIENYDNDDDDDDDDDDENEQKKWNDEDNRDLIHKYKRLAKQYCKLQRELNDILNSSNKKRLGYERSSSNGFSGQHDENETPYDLMSNDDNQNDATSTPDAEDILEF